MRTANLVQQISTSTGTGAFSLTSVSGRQAFDDAFGHGTTQNVFFYFITNEGASEYEWGLGHLSASTTLVRDTVLGGSNGTSAVNFSAGTKLLTSDMPAGDQLRQVSVMSFIPQSLWAAIQGFSSTTDIAAYIVAAVAVASTLRCNVYWPAGQYTLGSTITIANSYVRFIGDGPLNTIIRRDFASGPTFAFNASANALLINPGVVGMAFNRNTTTALSASDVAHIKIVSGLQSIVSDVRMDNTVEGIEIIGGDLFYFNRLQLVGDYTASDKARFGLKSSQLATPVTGSHPQPSYVHMRDVWISGSGVNTGFAYPLWITSGEYWTVGEGCYFGQAKFYNVLIEQGTDNAIMLDFMFGPGCYLDSSGGDGVHITGSGVASGQTWNASARTGGDGSVPGVNFLFDGMIIKGNTTGAGDGVKVDGTARSGTYAQFVRGLKITNSSIASWLGNGVNIGGGRDITISSNQINGNNYSNSTSGSGLVLGANVQTATVANNRIGGDAFGDSGAAYQVYPVDIASGCTGYSVVDNRCENNVNAIRDQANSGIIWNNQTAASGTTAALRNPISVATALDGPLGISSSKAGGFSVNFTNNPAAGAISDLINYAFNLATDNGTLYNAGVMQIVQQVAANGSQSSAYSFYTTRAGSLSLEAVFGGGLQIGTAAGGAPGAGNLAAQGFMATAAPVTKTGTSSTVGATDSAIIYNASATHTTTLPSASGANTGRWLYLKSIAAFAINSASSNVKPIGSGTAGTAILSATAGKWAILQSDGSNWIVMAAN